MRTISGSSASGRTPTDPNKMFYDIWTYELVPAGAGMARSAPSTRAGSTATSRSAWCSTRTRPICPNVQAGMHSGGFRGLWIGRQELRIRHFHKVIDDYLFPPGSRPRRLELGRRHMTFSMTFGPRAPAASAYRNMKLIREFEERLHIEIATGEIPGFTHLYCGPGGRRGRGVRAADRCGLHRQHPPRPRPLHRQGMRRARA